MPEEPGESSVIERVLASAGQAEPRVRPRVGPGDDAAWLAGGEIVTTDVMVEGVHFDQRSSPADVGWKLVAVNASDVGAMGARPTWATLTLSLPRPLRMGWVEAFAEGLGAALARWRIALVGGDTTGSPGPVFAGMTMAGRAATPVLRSGARPGDEIWVSGALGEAAAGFFGTRAGVPEAGLAWLRRPEPPVELGARLGAAGLCTAMMDLSDGLAQDLPRLCAASGVGATVDPALLPVGPSLVGEPDPLPCQVAFGDDYQLLFTAPPAHGEAIRALGRRRRVRLSRVGTIEAGSGARLRGRDWPAPRFSHFEEPG